MNRFLVRSAGLDGWHHVGSLRGQLCPISKPAKMPRKTFNRQDAERLCFLRGRILSSKFAAPKIQMRKVEIVLGDF